MYTAAQLRPVLKSGMRLEFEGKIYHVGLTQHGIQLLKYHKNSPYLIGWGHPDACLRPVDIRYLKIEDAGGGPTLMG